jgi:hypothetical protein
VSVGADRNILFSAIVCAMPADSSLESGRLPRVVVVLVLTSWIVLSGAALWWLRPQPALPDICRLR